MDAVVAQMKSIPTLVPFLGLELAVLGHFEHSEWGLVRGF